MANLNAKQCKAERQTDRLSGVCYLTRFDLLNTAISLPTFATCIKQVTAPFQVLKMMSGLGVWPCLCAMSCPWFPSGVQHKTGVVVHAPDPGAQKLKAELSERSGILGTGVNATLDYIRPC